MKEQFIYVAANGTRLYYSNKEMTVLHREDGPAAEYRDGTKIWYNNGELHREDGPAIEYPSEIRYWLRNGKYHRTDGPAVEHNDGSKEWWVSGIFQRVENSPTTK